MCRLSNIMKGSTVMFNMNGKGGIKHTITLSLSYYIVNYIVPYFVITYYHYSDQVRRVLMENIIRIR